MYSVPQQICLHTNTVAVSFPKKIPPPPGTHWLAELVNPRAGAESQSLSRLARTQPNHVTD
jgi:hypothetical protein